MPDPKEPQFVTIEVGAGGAGAQTFGAAGSTDRHSQQRIAEMFETAALTIRRDALQKAVSIVGGQGDPGLVLDAARQFEAYLKGESQANRGAPGPHAEIDPTCRVMLSFNGDKTCTCDGMKSAAEQA